MFPTGHWCFPSLNWFTSLVSFNFRGNTRLWTTSSESQRYLSRPVPVSATLVSLSPSKQWSHFTWKFAPALAQETHICLFLYATLNFSPFSACKRGGWGEPSWWPTASHKGSADLHSLKEWHGAVSEKSQVGTREKFFTRVAGMGQAPQSSRHGSKLLELKELLGNTLRHRVWIPGGAAWSQELDSVTLVRPLPTQNILRTGHTSLLTHSVTLLVAQVSRTLL